MLPMALKIAWFVLSFTGMISCWAVLGAFASVLQTYWWALTYCFGVTCLEGIFWLGIVWQMDPSQMPRSFCLAQTFITAFASFILAGVVASSTLATLQFVSHPKTWSEGELYVLVWRKRYTFPLIVFPVLALVALIVVTLELDAVHPSNSMTCEANNPVWTRFLGYAGSPLLLCLPSFCVTLYCMVRVYKTHQHIKRSRTRYPDAMQDAFTAPPTRRPRAVPASPSDNDREQMSSSNTLTTRRFHFPFGPSHTDIKDSSRNSSRISMPRDVVSSDSADSDTFPTFAPPSNTPSILEIGVNNKESRDKTLETMDITSVTDVEKDVWRLKDMDASHTDTEIDGAMEMIQWRKGSLEQVSDMMGGRTGHGDVDDMSSWDKRMRHSTALSTRSRRPSLCTLPPIICRVIRFQLTFNIIQFISSISTLVYAIRGHSPPFILHHVCMVLFAWSPVFFFGTLPEVRHQLRFWSRQPPPSLHPHQDPANQPTPPTHR